MSTHQVLETMYPAQCHSFKTLLKLFQDMLSR